MKVRDLIMELLDFDFDAEVNVNHYNDFDLLWIPINKGENIFKSKNSAHTVIICGLDKEQ